MPREWEYRLSYWLSQRSRACSCLWLSIKHGDRLYYLVIFQLGPKDGRATGTAGGRASQREGMYAKIQSCKCFRNIKKPMCMEDNEQRKMRVEESMSGRAYYWLSVWIWWPGQQEVITRWQFGELKSEFYCKPEKTWDLDMVQEEK